MIGAIISGIFNLIMSLFNAILSPFISLITGLFPDLTNMISSVTSFLSLACTYVRSILSLLLIDTNHIALLFGYFITCYSIYIIALAVKFAIRVYNKLKI